MIKFKIAKVKSVDTVKIDLPDGFVGRYVVVPVDFPDEVCLMVWTHHYEARERWVGGGKSFITHPPADTPEEAWEAFRLGEYGGGL